MKTKPKVSIIVPVYKSEKYLDTCVESLLVQTLSDIEILLIDDGSPDNSGLLCDKFANSDSRVKVFHNTNHGVSYTRQFGLEHAQGEYVIYVDPDDWVDREMLETMYEKAVSEQADVVICDILLEKGTKRKILKQEPLSLEHQQVLREMFYRIHGSCCNKLIRTSCYRNPDVRFPLGLDCFEDLYVVSAIMKEPVKVVYLGKAFYHYVVGVNENSLVKTAKTSLSLLATFEAMLPHDVFMEYAVPVFFYRQVKAWYGDKSMSNRDFRRMLHQRKDCLSVLWRKKRKRFYKIQCLVVLSYLGIR